MKISKEVNELAREIKLFKGNEELTWSDCVGEAIRTLKGENKDMSKVEINRDIAKVKLVESSENKAKAIELVGEGWNFVRYNRFHGVYIFEKDGGVSFVDTTRTPRPKPKYKKEENLCAFEQGGVLDYLPGRCKA